MQAKQSFFRSISFIILLAFFVLGASFSCSSKSKKKTPGAGDKIYPVSVQKVSLEEVPDIAEVKGNFIPYDKLEVKSETEGKIISSPVSEGQMVNLGEPLASINPEPLNLLLEKQRLDLKEAEMKMEGSLSSKSSGRNPGPKGAKEGEVPGLDQNPDKAPAALPPDQVGEEPSGEQNASNAEKPENSDALSRAHEVSLDRIKADIALTEKKLESANVNAAISGMISKKNITEGSVVVLGEVLFQIIKIDPILLSVFVGKKDVGNLQKGERVEVKMDDLPDTSLSGEINYVGAELDPQNKNYEVRVSIPNTQLKIKAGMAGLAVLPQTGTRKALLIPEEAVLIQNGKKFVYVLENNQLAGRREVELGNKLGGKTEIKGGLKEAEQVIIKGQATFKEDQEFVKVENLQ